METKDLRDETRGRPPYDKLTIFFLVEEERRRTGKRLNAICDETTFVSVLPTEGRPANRFYDQKTHVEVAGETLRRRFYEGRADVERCNAALPMGYDDPAASELEDEIARIIALQCGPAEEFSQRSV